jgi:ubiquinone/menaquinone biosynthesis C-methylase UbiE
MLKQQIEYVERNGVRFLLDAKGKRLRWTPWIGEFFAPFYDKIMAKSVFPRKLGADIEKHREIMIEVLRACRGKRVLELAAGSGSASEFLPSDNRYTGTDISPGLLRQAAKKFRRRFVSPEFYVVSAADLPFKDEAFDLCLCLLALNFFEDAACVFGEVGRVLSPGGRLICAAPVPERNERSSAIRGILRSEEELEGIATACGFHYRSLPRRNGCLLYFQAHKPPGAA